MSAWLLHQIGNEVPPTVYDSTEVSRVLGHRYLDLLHAIVNVRGLFLIGKSCHPGKSSARAPNESVSSGIRPCSCLEPTQFHGNYSAFFCQSSRQVTENPG